MQISILIPITSLVQLYVHPIRFGHCALLNYVCIQAIQNTAEMYHGEYESSLPSLQRTTRMVRCFNVGNTFTLWQTTLTNF